MGICPRCGSWVDEGGVCRSCGGVREVEYGGYDEYDEGDEEVYDDSPRKYWTEIKKEIKLNIDDDLLKKRETEARKKVRQLITINQHSKKKI